MTRTNYRGNIFKKNIRLYNHRSDLIYSAFQMTSFGATQMRHGNFQATFKIKGQLYHTVGPLLQGIQEEPNIFTRTYLMGYGELERRFHVSSLIFYILTINKRIFHTYDWFIKDI